MLAFLLRWCARARPPAQKSSTVTDDHLSERLGLFVVPVGGLGLLERKHAIDDRLEPVRGDRAVQGEKLRATASGDAPEGHDARHFTAQDSDGTRLARRSRSGERPN